MKYRVTFAAKVFASAVVDAEDEGAALEAAFAESFPSICGQCSGWGRDYSLEFPDDPACWEWESTLAAD